jgi:hypothetical protein
MPEHGPALRLRSFLRPMWRHGGVLDRRRGLPHLNAHRSHPPTISLEHEMAAALRPPMDIHLNHGLLELPLEPTFPACFRRLWLARSGVIWTAWSSCGCGRVRGVWGAE